MPCIISLLTLLLSAHLLKAQTTIVISDLPENHPEGSKVYIAGSFNSWAPDDPNHKLTMNDSEYHITLNGNGSIKFKFTRGSWSTVEGGPNGEEINDRTYTFQSTVDTLQVTIASWKDLAGTSSPGTRSDNVTTIEDFEIPQLGRTRRLWVYTPPNYDFSNSYYRVVYMHDGQNLFDKSTSFSGEWAVDETLNDLYAQHGLELIVVGIDNGGDKRINEYSPWVNQQYGGGEGAAYSDFLVNTLKPYIDNNYRTLQGPDNTLMIGSSLGGLISHYAGLKHGDTFGMIGVLSPAYWFNPEIFDFTDTTSGTRSARIYLSAGGNESASIQQNMLKMADRLTSNGFTKVYQEVHPGHGHNETYWRTILPEVLAWLLETPNLLQAPSDTLNWHISDHSLSIHQQGNDSFEARVFNLSGQLLVTDSISSNRPLLLEKYRNQLLVIHLTGSGLQQVIKVKINP